MYDLRTYLATKDNLGGPIYLPEELSPHYQPIYDKFDDRPLTRGRIIGGIISSIALVGTGVYLFLSW